MLYTPLKQDNPIDNLNVQINDWKYSKSQNMMEVDLTLDDESADLYDLSFLSKARMTGNELQNLDSKVMYQSSSYIVIFIKNIPENYNEVLLSVTSELKTNNSSESVSLYTNRYKATKVDKIAKRQILNIKWIDLILVWKIIKTKLIVHRRKLITITRLLLIALKK